MDTATRNFILASLVYLVLGAVLGLGMAVAPGALYLTFSHVHLLLGGFMAMMVFGVGYFILPRFAGTALRWPGLVAVHFWMANLSLPAMVIARPLESVSGHPAWGGLFHTGALVQAVSLFLFSANLGLTLLAKKPAAVEQAPSRPPEEVKRPGALPMVGRSTPAPACADPGPATAVADIVDRKEGARELLVEAGLRPLQDPDHLEMVRKVGVTLGHACTKHGIEIDALLERLKALPDRAGADDDAPLTADDVIGRVVERYPAAREVLRQRFGDGCFTCPGFNTETLAQGALMHGVPVEDLIADLESVRRRGA